MQNRFKIKITEMKKIYLFIALISFSGNSFAQQKTATAKKKLSGLLFKKHITEPKKSLVKQS